MFEFRFYKSIDFALEKVLSKLRLPSARNPDPTKTAFSDVFFHKIAIDVSVTSCCVQMMTQITESKNQQVERSENVFFEFLSNSSIN